MIWQNGKKSVVALAGERPVWYACAAIGIHITLTCLFYQNKRVKAGTAIILLGFYCLKAEFSTAFFGMILRVYIRLCHTHQK